MVAKNCCIVSKCIFNAPIAGKKKLYFEKGVKNLIALTGKIQKLKIGAGCTKVW